MHVSRAGRLARMVLLATAWLAPGVGLRADPPAVDPALDARLRRLEARVLELSRQLKPPPAPRAPAAPPATVEPSPLGAKAIFGRGFDLSTADDEYQCQFHDLAQLDARVFARSGQDPVKDTFGIPRQWLMISGRLTKPYEYFVSLAQGFSGGVTALDVFINFHFDDRLQVKAGRYFVPFTYEPYVIPIRALIVPEWSLFFNNFEPNRDVGVMAWGSLARERVDYAAGIFNGNKNGFVDTDNFKDFIGFLNVKPFRVAGVPALENLNVGGSVLVGNESSPPNPRTLRTAVSIPGNATIGVPFLTFADNVSESGPRALWSGHAAYYYRRLSLVGEVDGGYQTYAGGGGPSRTRLPLRSFYVMAGYFLTGETVAARGTVQPLRPFDLRKGKLGPGAWELGGRVNFLGLGDQVFTRGLADPNLWTDRVTTTDLGLNWYWNPFVRVAFFWEHAGFGQPVLYRPGARQLTSDLFLVRFQLWF